MLQYLRLPEVQQQMGYGETLQKYLFVLMDLREFLQESVEGFFRKTNARLLAQCHGRLVLDAPGDHAPEESFADLLDQTNGQGFYPVLLLDEFDKITRNKHFNFEF